jgi:hypothetical protein
MPNPGYQSKDHKYVYREMQSNGTYRYYYEDDLNNGSKPSSSPRAETGSWVSAWNNSKNGSGKAASSGSSSTASTSSGKSSRGSRAVSRGKSAVSKYLNINESKEKQQKKLVEKYNDKASRMDKQLETDKRRYESYYRERQSAEKERYRQSLIDSLTADGAELTDAQKQEIEDKVDKYGEYLWENTYKDLLDKANKKAEQKSKLELRKYASAMNNK